MPESIDLSRLISEYVIPWGINVALALAVFVIGRWISKIILKVLVRVLKRSDMDEILINFVSSIASTGWNSASHRPMASATC